MYLNHSGGLEVTRSVSAAASYQNVKVFLVLCTTCLHGPSLQQKYRLRT